TPRARASATARFTRGVTSWSGTTSVPSMSMAMARIACGGTTPTTPSPAAEEGRDVDIVAVGQPPGHRWRSRWPAIADGAADRQVLSLAVLHDRPGGVLGGDGRQPDRPRAAGLAKAGGDE